MGNTKGFWSRWGLGREAQIAIEEPDMLCDVPLGQPPAPQEAMRGTRLGSFMLQRRVAQGGQGDLHLATDATTGLPVAIKTIHLGRSEVARDRFMHETTAAAHLQHPDIVRSYAAGTDGTGDARCGWIAMEWVSGEDLGQVLTGNAPPSASAVLNIAARVAAALAYAHRKGVLHRDIKPGNVMIQRRSGLVKLTDFGCAKAVDAKSSRSGVMVGTPAYMAPEQLAGLPLDGRADFYSLGVLVFQALAGRLPFEGGSMGALLSQIAQEPAPLLSELRPDLPKPVGHLLASLLAKQAVERPPDGDELSRELCMMALACELMPPDDRALPRHNV